MEKGSHICIFRNPVGYEEKIEEKEYLKNYGLRIVQNL